MMWVATINGLSRFDGYHFNNFHSGKDSGSFINNVIFDLCEDKEGNLWGSTKSGIFCYQTREDKFINYIPPTYEFARSVYNIICDMKGDIWATTEWNIVKLNKQKNLFEEIGQLTRNYDSLVFYSVRQNGLCEDPSGRGLWFATRGGLYYYSIAEKKFYGHHNIPGDSLFTNHSVAALTLAPGGYFWFFDNRTKKIIAFDPATRKILRQIPVEPSIKGAIGQTLFEDSNGMLWFSSWNYKCAVIDYRKNIITPLAYKNDNPLSVAGNSFWDVFEDEDKNIWLATSGGLSKCNYSKNVYSIIPLSDDVPEFKNSSLGAFSLDPRDNSWWIASEGANVSVIHYYPESRRYRYFDFSKSIKNSAGQPATPVFSINFIDGKPYVCTHTGVWLLDEKTGRVIPYEKKFENWGPVFYSYVVENGDDLWFSTKEFHIKWNKKTNRTVKVKADVDLLPDGQKIDYSRIFIDKNKRLWFVPAFGWLANIDAANQVRLKYYIKNKAGEQTGYLTSITDDKEGNLWMASTSVGLYKYNIVKDEMKLYDQSDGITTFIKQAMFDKQGRIWIAAMNKFSVFNPVSKSISHYNLPVYENTLDYSNKLLQDSSGAMLATLNRDIVKFIPERVNLKPVMKEPLLSKIKISGKERLITDEIKLFLEPDENSLEFSFGSLISQEIFPYSFEYRLDDYNKNWVTATNIATALYSNLRPGKYIFRVRAVARDKSWQTPERKITLVIRTPFYKSGWFWLLMGLLLIGALILFFRFRINKQKQILSLETKAQQLEKEKAMVMYDSLKQQLNPHFLFNSLTSLSGLIETNQQVAGNFLEQMSGIYRYILKNGDNETVAIKDEINFVNLYISLQQTRFKKGLQVNINVPDDFLHYKIAPVTLQNLIENAIKHNIIDADSPLVIDIFIENDYVVVKNNLQKKSMVETSNKKGLAQFETLYKYLSDKPIIIEETDHYFTIKIPLI